jgi:hypothetical protein
MKTFADEILEAAGCSYSKEGEQLVRNFVRGGRVFEQFPKCECGCGNNVRFRGEFFADHYKINSDFNPLFWVFFLGTGFVTWVLIWVGTMPWKN